MKGVILAHFLKIYTNSPFPKWTKGSSRLLVKL